MPHNSLEKEHPLAELGLPSRVYLALKAHRVKTVEQLGHLGPAQLRDMGIRLSDCDRIRQAVDRWSTKQRVEDMARPKDRLALIDVWGLDHRLLVDHTCIEALRLDVGTRRALIAYGTPTVALLAALTLPELRQVNGITPAALETIRVNLGKYCQAKGIGLRTPHPLSSASVKPLSKKEAEHSRPIPTAALDGRGEAWRSKLAEWLAEQPEGKAELKRDGPHRTKSGALRTRTARGAARPTARPLTSNKPSPRPSAGNAGSTEQRSRATHVSDSQTTSSTNLERPSASTPHRRRVGTQPPARRPLEETKQGAEPAREPRESMPAPNADLRATTGQLDQAIALWLASLDERRRRIVETYYGLGRDRRTMGQIARQLGVTAARIQQLVRQAKMELAALQPPGSVTAHIEAIRRFVRDSGGLASEEEIRRGLRRYVSLGDLDPLTACRILAGVDAGLIWLRGPRLLADHRNPVDKIDTIRSGVRACAGGEVGPLSLNHVLFLFCESRFYREECGRPTEEFVLACLRTDPGVEVREGVIRWAQ